MMAIERESPESPTKLLNKPSNELYGINNSASNVELGKLDSGDHPVQVPSTAPEKTQDNDQHMDELDDEEPEDAEADVSDGDLAPFDWEDLCTRYTQEIRAISEQEDLILKDFDLFAEVFAIWAEAGADHDNKRAMKRLKTRERYVQIAESSLEDKKNHYIEVVAAFKKALDLLRR